MNVKLNKRTSFLTLAVLGAGLLAGAAQAAASGEAAVKVAYGDLNLSTPAGSEVLYRRIVAAARQVCAVDTVDIRDLRARASVRSCETQAIANAVHQVPSSALAAMGMRRTSMAHGVLKLTT